MTGQRQHQPYPAPTTMFKGGACTNCRKRKIRCDGARPICRACHTSSDQFSDCEYTDSGATPSQRLEERIAILEARLHELEAQRQPSEPQCTSPRLSASRHSSPSDPSSQHPVLGSTTTSNLDLIVSHRKFNAQDVLSLEPSLSAELHQTLLNKFMQHATAELAFFLNGERFLGSLARVERSSPAIGTGTGSGTRALLDVMYLWSAHLSPKLVCHEYETRFLSNALRKLSHGIANFEGSRDAGQIIHTIQASILIAQYFFRNSRFVEGKYHLTNAQSLAIGARLHAIRSAELGGGPRSPRSPVLPFAVSTSVLHPHAHVPPPPRDSIEEGERINGFWSVVVLDCCWMSVDAADASGSRACCSNMVYTSEPGLRIDTPWPEDMGTYVVHGIPSDLVGSQTVERFLRGVDTDKDNRNGEGQSWMALHAKSSILFERATRVGLVHWRNISTHSPNTPRSSAQFVAIHSAIQALFRDLGNKQQAPSSPSSVVAPFSSSSSPMQIGIVVSLLVNVARIRLHEHFTDQCEQSDCYVMTSARNVVRIVAHYDSWDRHSVLDPIIAPLLWIGFKVLVDKINIKVNININQSPALEAEELKTQLRTLVDVMDNLSSRCPMMLSQAVKAHSLYDQLP